MAIFPKYTLLLLVKSDEITLKLDLGNGDPQKSVLLYTAGSVLCRKLLDSVRGFSCTLAFSFSPDGPRLRAEKKRPENSQHLR